MKIVYVRFGVSMHNLDISSPEEMENLRCAIEDAVRCRHPKRIKDVLPSDVVVEIEEHAGSSE